MTSLHPPGSEWKGLLAARAGSRPPEAAEFRAALGLPTDRPLILTGHQAQLWHPGIVAKALAADALAGGGGTAVAWVLVDQDANAPAAVRLPVRRAEGAKGNANGAMRRLRTETWLIDPRAPREAGEIPTGRQAALRPAPAPTLEPGESWAAPGVGPGIEAIIGALREHKDAPSAAVQIGRALAGLLRPMLETPPAVVMATAISGTSLFAAVVERLRAEPEKCIALYNQAVAAHPRERVQPLKAGELPLWAIDPAPGSPRRRVRIDDLGSIPVAHLAPRALLMTGLLRWAGCDLFIHGTGGGGGDGDGHAGYDRITEQWMREWLGVDLAPSVVATATMHLRIPGNGPGPAERRHAQWLAHKALHEPALLGDAGAEALKRRMVAEIEAAKKSGGNARELYRQMHALLERTRQAHADRLRRLQADAQAAAAGLSDAQIAQDRTWAFPLYEADQMAGLRAAVAAQVGRA